MLAKVVKELITHVDSQHSTDSDEKNVDYSLLGRFDVNRKNGVVSSLEFYGGITGVSPNRFAAFRTAGAHFFLGGSEVVESTIDLARKLLDVEKSSYKSPSLEYAVNESYGISLSDSVTIKVQGSPEEFMRELDEIKQLFGEARLEQYPI